ncbi:MAG: hypothetical protein QOG11_1681 [Solirubrobacteraceae bacterium]|nr:hypothetical protein [Solirubrobacteraceae bacterium]
MCLDESGTFAWRLMCLDESGRAVFVRVVGLPSAGWRYRPSSARYEVR